MRQRGEVASSNFNFSLNISRKGRRRSTHQKSIEETKMKTTNVRTLVQTFKFMKIESRYIHTNGAAQMKCTRPGHEENSVKNGTTAGCV